MIRSNSKLTFALAAMAIAFVALACSSLRTEEPTSQTTPVNAEAPNNSVTPILDVKEIDGEYTILGTNEGGGGEYQGSLSVKKRDDVYQFSWTSGDRTYDGVGVRTDNAVSVSFTEGNDGKGCGVVLYTIENGGQLVGKAGYWGVNIAESETARRTKGSGLEGEYEVSGRNPGGSQYNGKLAVTKSGAGYEFSWATPDSLKGFGILSGGKVTVGFGGEKCGFVAYNVMPDGSLVGKWGSPGSKSVGTETAKKK